LPPDDAGPETVAGALAVVRRAGLAAAGQAALAAPFLGVHARERDAGETTAVAFRAALEGVLTSRHFICLVEGEPTARDRLTDWELAARLSYLLWSSMPDDALRDIVSIGRIHSRRPA